nr:hypothetical protein PanWU01x14_262120 [Ipomoea batatas]
MLRTTQSSPPPALERASPRHRARTTLSSRAEQPPSPMSGVIACSASPTKHTFPFTMSPNRTFHGDRKLRRAPEMFSGDVRSIMLRLTVNVGGSESAEPIQAFVITGKNTEANATAEMQPELFPETTPLRKLHGISDAESIECPPCIRPSGECKACGSQGAR